jgi:hypothetical protein
VASLTKLSGRWMGSLTLQDESPGYEISDVGFEVYTNRRAVATDVGYATYRPGRLFRNYRADLFTTHEWDYDWNRITFDIGLNQSARFRNFWQVNLVTHLYPAPRSRSRCRPELQLPIVFGFGRDFRSRRNTAANNLLAAKLSYWLGL